MKESPGIWKSDAYEFNAWETPRLSICSDLFYINDMSKNIDI